MTRKSTYIFSGVIYLIFFTSILYFFISIGTSIKGEKSKASFSFNTIVQEINDYINTSFNNENFDIDLIASNYTSLKTLKIEKNNTIYYEYHSANPEANKISTTKIFSKTIPYFNNTTAVLTAEYNILKPETIYNSAKKIFIIILITTFITLILIFTTTKEKKFNGNIKEKPVKPVTDDINDQWPNESLVDESQNNLNKINFENNTLEINQNISLESEFGKEPNNNNIEINDSQLLSESDFTDEPAIENFENLEETGSNQTAEIIKPEENITDNSFVDIENSSEPELFNNDILQDYLDTSLQNATENEQDLSFAIIKFNILNNNVLDAIKEQLLNITPQNNIFKFEDNAIAIIINDNDIDEAVIKAQDLYNKINDVLTNKNINVNFAIGLSSKSLRIVAANRLINEADQAVERAFGETELPIVAFKVNPDKYREHISNI